MHTLKWSAFSALIIVLCAYHSAQGGEIKHQRGIELRGGYGLYLDMSDPNNFAEDFTGTSGYLQSEFSESLGSFSGGFSLLYKTRPYFGWHIGLNILSTDSATATAVQGSQVQTARVFMNAVEIFVTANYYWNLSPRINIHLGAGPAFYLSTLDREVTTETQSVYGESFYGAHGRTFGFTGGLGCEFFLSSAVSLKVGGGFRLAPISRFKYFRELVGPEGKYDQGEIAYWQGTFDTFEADFSGAFVDIGLRIYFEPAAPWNEHGRKRTD